MMTTFEMAFVGIVICNIIIMVLDIIELRRIDDTVIVNHDLTLYRREIENSRVAKMVGFVENNVKCIDCKHCAVLADDPEGRYPFPFCRKDHEIKVLNILDWKPEVRPCRDFKEGECEWI